MITQQTVTTKVAVGYCDSLGYAYCSKCHHSIEDKELTRCDARATFEVWERCDRCSLPLWESIEEIKGNAMIEYPFCRIF